jgi:hypothetical protein
MANHALVVYDRATGEVVHFLELPDRVHKHGLAIGHGRLFAALRNGSVVSVADVAPGDVNIERFTANMAAATPDQTLTVAWSVANADSVTLNPGSRRLSASGSTAVEVEADQPIQLRAEGPGGAVTRTLPLRVMEPIAAEPIDDLKPGLRASYVSRDKDPSVTSTVPDLWQNHGGAFRDSGMNDNFAATFAGYITVPKTGAYRFKLDTDDGGSLRIAGELVTANSAFGKSVGVIALEAGVHPIVASLEEGRGGAKIQVSWQGPGMEKLEPVPADAFGHHDR